MSVILSQLDTAWDLAAILLGPVAGSFLGLVSLRLPEEKKVVKGRKRAGGIRFGEMSTQRRAFFCRNSRSYFGFRTFGGGEVFFTGGKSEQADQKDQRKKGKTQCRHN